MKEQLEEEGCSAPSLEEIVKIIDLSRSATDNVPMLWWEGSADGWDQLLPFLQAAKAETDEFCSPEEEEQDYTNHVPLHDATAVGKEINMSCVTEWMSRKHNSVTTLYLTLCWQWMSIGRRDHATGLPMRPPRGKDEAPDPLVFTVSARKVHGRTAYYGWRTAAPGTWEDSNPAACNVLAELWLTNLLREGGKRPVSLIAGVYRRITPIIVGRLVENLPLERREPVATALLANRRQVRWRVDTQETGMTVKCLNETEAACVTRRLYGYIQKGFEEAPL